jgi:hypothetical protein
MDDTSSIVESESPSRMETPTGFSSSSRKGIFSPTRQQAAESQRVICEYDRANLSPTSSVRRFDTAKFNVLKNAGREVAHESLSAGAIGRNGLHRFDATPGEQEQYAPRDYYLAELQKKKGTTNFTDGGLFIVKGLHNFSNLPSGDARVLRTSSTSKEQFLHPDQRAPNPPLYSHLQASEQVDSDGSIGPATVTSSFTAASTVDEAAEIQAHRARCVIFLSVHLC